MSSSLVFRPVWKNGLILHSILAVLLAGSGGFLIWLAFQQHFGGLLILCFFGALLLLGLFALVVYRAYGLYHASYTIEREGLRIQWGLRREDIPLTEVEWVRTIDELLTPLKPPMFSMPGAYQGVSYHSDLGKVDFIASDFKSMVIIETTNKVLALSPENPEDFIRSFQRTLEMGSITPIDAYSSQPAEFIQNVFSYPAARGTLITGLLFTLALVVLTSLFIPYKQTVSMGVTPLGTPLDAVTSNRLLILPILGSILFILDVLIGLYYFRKNEQRKVSYLLWFGGIATPFLLTIALLMMVL